MMRLTMGLRLFVLRHGETAWSRERRFTGARDVPLSDAGRRQCEQVAAALAPAPLGAVYASPQERARTTAEALAKPHRLEVRVMDAFREMAFGDWEGLTRDEVAARFPDDWATWREAPDRLVRPGAETLGAVAARVGAGLEAIRAAHPDGTAALVTHAIVVRLLVLGALGLGPDRLWTIDATPAGITEIEYRDDQWITLHRVNTVAHLAEGAS
jgi:broad specificity phosphatase PhoE